MKLSRLAGEVKGRTSNGGVNVELDGTSWRGEGLDVETSNGGVNLRIPEQYSAHLETGTVNGGLNLDIPVTVQGQLGGKNGRMRGSRRTLAAVDRHSRADQQRGEYRIGDRDRSPAVRCPLQLVMPLARWHPNAREGSMGSSPIARLLDLLACAVLAYDSAGVTSASQQSPHMTSGASAPFISAPATLSSKAVKNPYRQIFPVSEVKARPQTVEILPNPAAPA